MKKGYFHQKLEALNKAKVYHGTKKPDLTFNQEHADNTVGRWGTGTYFTDSQKEAKGYGQNIHEKDIDTSNHLDLHTPFDINKFNDYAKDLQHLPEVKTVNQFFAENNNPNYIDMFRSPTQNNEAKKFLSQYIKNQGYDGVRYEFRNPSMLKQIAMLPLNIMLGSLAGSIFDQFGIDHSQKGNPKNTNYYTFFNADKLNNPTSKSEQIKDSYFHQKLEALNKGSLQRRHKFNPAQVNLSDRQKTEDWTEGSGERGEVPRMEGNDRFRALQRLHGLTPSRRNPKTGEREFLLHHGQTFADIRNGELGFGGKASFTPDPKVAAEFTKEHICDLTSKMYGCSPIIMSHHNLEDHPVTSLLVNPQEGQTEDEIEKLNEQNRNTIKQHFGNIYSAWVPESRIHSIPNQWGTSIHEHKNTEKGVPGPQNRRDEHEVIINTRGLDYNTTKHDNIGHLQASRQKHLNAVRGVRPVPAQLRLIKSYFHQKLENLNKASPAAPHNDHIRSVADSYASSKGLKIQHGTPKVKVDPQFASRVASAYHTMEHSPSSPDTKASYDALISETTDQLHHLQRNGYKFTPIKPEQPNPYASGSAALSADLKANKHAHYYPTDQGFGSGDSTSPDHPMLRTIKDLHGNEMPANDAFRVVHDIFGHAKEGHQFGPNGEEAAYRDHSQMFSPLARRALTAETRGQNSWVNFGPHAEHNRANPGKTIFADQKAGLLPTWAEEHYQNQEPIIKGENMDTPKPIETPEETPSQKYFKDKIKQIKDKFNAEQEAKSSAAWKNNIKAAAVDAKTKDMKKSIVRGSMADTMPKTFAALSMDGDIHDEAVMRHHMKLHQNAAMKAPTPEARVHHWDNVKAIDAHLKSMKPNHGMIGHTNPVIKAEPPKEPPTLNYATMEPSKYKPWHWKEKLAASKRNAGTPKTAVPAAAPAPLETTPKTKSFRDYANGIKSRGIKKSENLEKSRITPNEKLTSWALQQKSILRQRDGEAHVGSKDLGNGLYHHVYDSRQNEDYSIHFGADTKHTLSKSPDPASPGMAAIYVKSGDGYTPEVFGSLVGDKHRGQGYGQALYKEAIRHHGSLQSGENVSMNAHKAWVNLQKDPELHVTLAPYPDTDGRGRHMATIAQSKPAVQKEEMTNKLKGGKADGKDKKI